MEENLILQNQEEMCVGKYTFGRSGSARSTIDMLLANDNIYDYCESMNISEEGEILRFIDHNLITVNLKLRMKVNERYKNRRKEKRPFYKKDLVSLGRLITNLPTTWHKEMIYHDMWDGLEKAQSEVLQTLRGKGGRS